MNKVIKMIFIAIGALLILNAVIMIAVSNYNLGILLTFLGGISSLFYGLFLKKINAFFRNRKLKWIRYLIYTGLLFMFGILLFIGIYGQHDTISGKEDAIVILGAGVNGETVTLPLMQRLDKGIACWKENPNAVIVVTGGQGAQERITEAIAMERYLLSKGIPQVVIFKEEQATSTYENFTYSKEMLDRYFNRSYQIAFITNDFHIYRASALAKIAGLNYTHAHAPLEWYTMPMAYLREFLAVLKLWVFGA